MSILNRTRFYSKDKNGIVDFSAWAKCTTTLGTMVEPFNPQLRGLNTDVAWDYTDMMNRVDELKQIDEGRRMAILAPDNEGLALHGGYCWLRG